MVNKPAALYLEDARRAREYIFHDMGPLASALANLTSPCSSSTTSMPTPTCGVLRTTTLILAPSHTHRLQQQQQHHGPATLSHSTLNSGASTAERLLSIVARSSQSHALMVSPRLSRPRLRSNPAVDVLYGRLDTGYLFECHVSRHGTSPSPMCAPPQKKTPQWRLTDVCAEAGSYISLDLLHHISPRPDFTPSDTHSVLRYNDEPYTVAGHAHFAIEVRDPQDSTRHVSFAVSATVIRNIYPDLFLGRDEEHQRA